MSNNKLTFNAVVGSVNGSTVPNTRASLLLTELTGNRIVVPLTVVVVTVLAAEALVLVVLAMLALVVPPLPPLPLPLLPPPGIYALSGANLPNSVIRTSVSMVLSLSATVVGVTRSATNALVVGYHMPVCVLKCSVWCSAV